MITHNEIIERGDLTVVDAGWGYGLSGSCAEADVDASEGLVKLGSCEKSIYIAIVECQHSNGRDLKLRDR